MSKASYEILPDDGTFYGEIPGFDGVYANADTLERCREEVEEIWQSGSCCGFSSISHCLLLWVLALGGNKVIVEDISLNLPHF